MKMNDRENSKRTPKQALAAEEQKKKVMQIKRSFKLTPKNN